MTSSDDQRPAGSFEPGVLTAESGRSYLIDGLIGTFERTPCDDPTATRNILTGQCRCTVCARCHHHTGNSHQGHWWKFCKVTRTMREFHFCCEDPAYGCELEAAAGKDSD